MKHTSLIAVETLSLDEMRSKVEELAKYVRAARAINDLVTSYAKEPDTQLAATKTLDAVQTIFNNALANLAKREASVVSELYAAMTLPRT